MSTAWREAGMIAVDSFLRALVFLGTVTAAVALAVVVTRAPSAPPPAVFTPAPASPAQVTP